MRKLGSRQAAVLSAIFIWPSPIENFANKMCWPDEILRWTSKVAYPTPFPGRQIPLAAEVPDGADCICASSGIPSRLPLRAVTNVDVF